MSRGIQSQSAFQNGGPGKKKPHNDKEKNECGQNNPQYFEKFHF
jgi:hypothetical protein